MASNSVLDSIALGYSPMIDAKRAVMATRVTVFPLKVDAPPPAAELLAVIASVWSGDASRVSLNIASEALLREVMQALPATNLMLEVPSFMAGDTANVPSLLALRERGNVLLLKGRPLQPLPKEVLPCFRYSLIDLADERRSDATPNAAFTRTMEFVQSGVKTLEEVEASFRRGAKAVLGWPLEGVSPKSKKPATGITTVVDLIQRLDREEPVERLEASLRADPTLAFRLMRYINSPAFGLSVEINSFRHAIMILGYQRLKRWLALLLATASDDPAMRPLMFAAVRRGLMMEELVRNLGDETQRNELFICGVFSLLDRMLGQPFGELLKSLPVPEKVVLALEQDQGPYRPYLELVMAAEQASVYDMQAMADNLLMSPAELNTALLKALSNAQQLG